jgi:hypothetical protein
MSLDAQVRTYLSNMRPGTEVDARGLARALGGVDPLEADYALERAEKAGLSSTSDGRWFGPAAKSSHNHAKMLNSPLEHVEGVVLPNGAQAEIHIHHGNGGYSGVLVSSRGAEVPMSLGAPAPKSLDEAIRGAKRFLQQVYGKSGDSGRASSGSHEHSPIKLKDRGRGHVWLTVRDGRVIGVMGSYPDRYMGMTLEEARHLARYGSRGASAPRSSHAVRRKARAARVTAYRILLTPDELRAVEFARGRYAWPDMLSAHAAEDGAVAFTESEMWQWTDDVDSDAEGGHSPFPLASPAFAEKLQRFYDSRV